VACPHPNAAGGRHAGGDLRRDDFLGGHVRSKLLLSEGFGSEGCPTNGARTRWRVCAAGRRCRHTANFCRIRLMRASLRTSKVEEPPLGVACGRVERNLARGGEVLTGCKARSAPGRALTARLPVSGLLVGPERVGGAVPATASPPEGLDAIYETASEPR
jgi:hypothetical protein